MNCVLLVAFACSLAQMINCKVDKPRGVAISKSGFYVSGRDFACLDGSLTIPFDHVNDDYCDCADASDEPGTTACPNGSFHCTNAGHKPLNMPSSRVNDGICDCCDGTDEYDGTTSCDNVCKEIGRAAREEAERVQQLILEGFEIYKEYTELGTDAKKQSETKLIELQAKKSEAEAVKNEKQEIKEEAEVPEKDAKDAHQSVLDEEKSRLDSLKSEFESSAAFEDLDKNNDGMLSVDEMQLHIEFDIDSNGDVSQEEAKEYLEDHDSIDNQMFRDTVWPNIKAIYTKSEEIATPDTEEPESDDSQQAVPLDDDETDYDYDRDDEEYYDDEDDEHHEDSNDDDEDDQTEPAEAENVPEYDENTKMLISVADKARADFNEADAHYKSIEKEFEEIQNFLKLDLGPNNVYYPLKDSCYEFTDREYTYKFCPFDRASQRSKSGGSETSLGKWGNWDGPEDNHYSVMKLENGQSCWNGPNRSVRVKIKCGLGNELISAAEPNKCEYEFEFLSPAACNEHVKTTAFQPTDHDEL